MTIDELKQWLRNQIAYRQAHWCCKADTMFINWCSKWLNDIEDGKWPSP